MSEKFGDVIILTRVLQDRVEKKRQVRGTERRKKMRGAEGLNSHWMFVVHDREELVDRQHLAQRFGSEELLSSL